MREVAVVSSRSTPAISLDSRVAARRDVACCDNAGEAVLLQLKTEVYYGLDSVGSHIWSLIQHPVRVGDLRDALVAEYEVEPGRCERSLLEFLGQLQGAGLIQDASSA